MDNSPSFKLKCQVSASLLWFPHPKAAPFQVQSAELDVKNVLSWRCMAMLGPAAYQVPLLLRLPLRSLVCLPGLLACLHAWLACWLQWRLIQALTPLQAEDAYALLTPELVARIAALHQVSTVPAGMYQCLMARMHAR